ncbi:MAG: GDP-L-fucose synthase [Sphingomonas sp.]|nr:GDP-L-fucose synthase [Sphingomonas sp.]
MADQFDLAGSRVWVAGDQGMVGRAITRRLLRETVTMITPPTRIDLRDQATTFAWMEANPVDLVFVAAAKVGGIAVNSAQPGQFLYDNLLIAANVIEGARRVGVKKLVFLGSSCIYPRLAPQPIAEAALLSGPLEPTNQWYALAKIAGLKLCEAYRIEYGCDFIAAQPTNLYGPFDNFDLASSHVLPALIRKAHEAKIADAATLTVWGSGAPYREFLHVDDLADALVFLARHYSDNDPVNIGSGDEINIGALAKLVTEIVGFTGCLIFDQSYPDGTPRKRLDTKTLDSLGWHVTKSLRTGITETYDWFKTNVGTP